MRRSNPFVVTVCMIAMSAVMGGCLVMSKTHRSHEGRIPSTATIGQIEPGQTTIGWLIAAAGEPTSRERADEHTELLVYRRATTVRKEAGLFLVFWAEDTTKSSEKVVFEAVDGVVVRHWTESGVTTSKHRCSK